MAQSPPARSSVDREFCKRLPKVELHAHLTGSITRQCLHDVWKQKKDKEENFDLEDPFVVIPASRDEYTNATFFSIFSSYIYKLCCDIPSIKHTTRRVINDFEADNVVYLELRTTPRSYPQRGITNELYVQTVLECVNEHNRRPDARLKSRLILSIDRRWTAEVANEVVELAIKYRPKGIVGVDLCGDPTKGDVSTFKPAFAKAKAAGLKITLHFAETASSSSDKELNNLLDMRPDRLGHVIHVKEDMRKKIIEKGIGVELCLSCNVQMKMITGGFPDHHFSWWRNAGGSIALGTDDVGVFESPLSEEYYLTAQHFGLRPEDIKTLCEGAITVAFTTPEDKKRLTEWLHTWYQNTMRRR